MEKDEWNGNIIGYKGEGEQGLRELLGGEKVLKTYRFRNRTRDLSDEGGLGGGEEVGDGLMRDRIGEWKGGYGVLEEEQDVLEERGEGGGN